MNISLNIAMGIYYYIKLTFGTATAVPAIPKSPETNGWRDGNCTSKTTGKGFGISSYNENQTTGVF